MLDGEVPSKGVFGNASAISLMGNNKLFGGIPKLELPACPIKSTGQRKHENSKLIISIRCVISFLLLSSVVAVYHARKGTKKPSSNSTTIDMVSRASYQRLHNATDQFSVNNMIGSRSFGYVYKGCFESNEVVVVKVINLQMRGGNRSFGFVYKGFFESNKFSVVKVINLQIRRSNKSFVAKCNALRKTRHQNLVKFKSCCSSIDNNGHEFKDLVCKYMVNGSLANWLHPRTENLDHPRVLLLNQIINILIDVASMLRYLHHDASSHLFIVI